MRRARASSTARLLELFAAIDAAGGAARTAAERLGAADALREHAGLDPTYPEQQDRRRIRKQVAGQLPAEAVAAAGQRGRAADLTASGYLRL